MAPQPCGYGGVLNIHKAKIAPHGTNAYAKLPIHGKVRLFVVVVELPAYSRKYYHREFKALAFVYAHYPHNVCGGDPRRAHRAAAFRPVHKAEEAGYPLPPPAVCGGVFQQRLKVAPAGGTAGQCGRVILKAGAVHKPCHEIHQIVQRRVVSPFIQPDEEAFRLCPEKGVLICGGLEGPVKTSVPILGAQQNKLLRIKAAYGASEHAEQGNILQRVVNYAKQV